MLQARFRARLRGRSVGAAAAIADERELALFEALPRLDAYVPPLAPPGPPESSLPHHRRRRLAFPDGEPCLEIDVGRLYPACAGFLASDRNAEDKARRCSNKATSE